MPGSQSAGPVVGTQQFAGALAGFRDAFEQAQLQTIFGCCTSEHAIRSTFVAQISSVAEGENYACLDQGAEQVPASILEKEYSPPGSSASASTTATSPNSQDLQELGPVPTTVAPAAAGAASVRAAPAAATSPAQHPSAAAQAKPAAHKTASAPLPSAGRDKDSEIAPAVPDALGIETSGPSYNRLAPVASTADNRTRPMTSADLMATTQGIASNVVTWNPDNFTRVKLLQDAVRNHGRVDLMCRKDEKGVEQVAVKRMPTSWVQDGPAKFKEAYPRSSELPWCDIGMVGHLNSIKYPYVCDLIGVYRDQLNTFVVSSLATEGDLFGWCPNEPLPGPQREAKMLPLAKQIFTAVRWLHNLGVAHRDLSLENILLTDVGGGEMQIKLIDFGMATLAKSCLREVRGKASYQAPEMHGDIPFDPMALDHFAVGVVLFAMAAQDYPWTATTPNSCRLFEYVKMFGLRKFLSHRRVRKGGPEKHLADVFSPEFVDLMEGMLAFDPTERATLGENCYKSGPKEDRSAKNAKWFKQRRDGH